MSEESEIMAATAGDAAPQGMQEFVMHSIHLYVQRTSNFFMIYITCS